MAKTRHRLTLYETVISSTYAKPSVKTYLSYGNKDGAWIVSPIQRGATIMAKADRQQLDRENRMEKLLADIEAEVEYLILVEMMKEAWEELKKEQPKLFGFDCY
jgi:hypothetical protein